MTNNGGVRLWVRQGVCTVQKQEATTNNDRLPGPGHYFGWIPHLDETQSSTWINKFKNDINTEHWTPAPPLGVSSNVAQLHIRSYRSKPLAYYIESSIRLPFVLTCIRDMPTERIKCLKRSVSDSHNSIDGKTKCQPPVIEGNICRYWGRFADVESIWNDNNDWARDEQFAIRADPGLIWTFQSAPKMWAEDRNLVFLWWFQSNTYEM